MLPSATALTNDAMPAPAPFPSTTAAGVNGIQTNGANALFPALYLYPLNLNDTWAPKHIALTSQHTKIGRQTSSKTAPGERNGFFDSKVLSRQHAEVWEENGKIYIKDVKSSNGTFINGERLSSEGQESEPFELKSDDIVEFGIDIVGEDNKTIIHHKVAARVVCVFNEQDAQVAARAEQHQAQQQLQQHQYLQTQSGQGGAGGGPSGSGPTSGINGLGGLAGGIVGGGAQSFPPFAAQRRAQLAQQGLGSMGGMRPPGKTGLSFDVILSRLQGEVQKSRETGAELTSLTTAMTEIHDTLGGAVPNNLPPFPAHLPPVRPPQESQPPAPSSTAPNATANGSTGASASATAPAPAPAAPSTSPEQPSALNGSAATISAAAVVDLQSQLRDTQSSLATHLDKVRALESVLAEHEGMKREVSTLREMMEERRREMEALRRRKEEERRREEEGERGDGQEHEQDQEGVEEDDDDARSIASTVMGGGHELERVEEEDEEQLAEEERRQGEEDSRILDESIEESALDKSVEYSNSADAEEDAQRREELDVGRPHTPEPTLGLHGNMDTYRARRSPLAMHTSTSTSTSTTTSPPQSQTQTHSQPSPPSEDVYDQVQKLTHQVTSIMALTSTLEAQHTSAQGTIAVLENKVASLEAMLRAAEEALAAQSLQHQGVQTQAQSQAQVQTQGAAGVMAIPLPVPIPSSEEVQVRVETERVEEVLERSDEGKVENEGRVVEGDEEEGEWVSELPEEETQPKPEPEESVEPESATKEGGLKDIKEFQSLTAFLAEWKSTVEGQWGTVQSEWNAERERLAKAREEWEAATRARELERQRELEEKEKEREQEKTQTKTPSIGGDVDLAALLERLEKMERIQSELVGQQEVVKAFLDQQAQARASGGPGAIGVNGEAIKSGHGLVTPPSPRSQSSDSGAGAGGRYRRRRRRSSAAGNGNSNGNGNARGRSRGSSGSRSRGDDDDTDATLASSTEDNDKYYDDEHHHLQKEKEKHGIARALGMVVGTATSIAAPVEAAIGSAAGRVGLATPAHSVSSSVGSLDGASGSASASGSGSSFSVGSAAGGSPLKSQLGPTRSNTGDGDDEDLPQRKEAPNQPQTLTDTASLLSSFDLTRRMVLMLFWTLVSFSFWVFLCFSRLRVWVFGWLGDWRSSSAASNDSSTTSSSLPPPPSRTIPLSSPLPLPGLRDWEWDSLSLSSMWNGNPPPPPQLQNSHSNPELTIEQTSSLSSSSAPPSPSMSTQSPMKDAPNINVQTAVGVVLLGVAAAAVFWKVKPE